MTKTVGEPWACHPHEVAWGGAGKGFALELGPGNNRHCLVVGSPVFELKAIQDHGWRTTFVDVRRPPPDLIPHSIVADIAELPFVDQSFDAAASSCVLCHAGLGRYGDSVAEDGDLKGLRELARVLRPGALAAILFGPCAFGLDETLALGTVHRIYRPESALALATEAGFLPLGVVIWCKQPAEETREGERTAGLVDNYLAILLKRSPQ